MSIVMQEGPNGLREEEEEEEEEETEVVSRRAWVCRVFS